MWSIIYLTKRTIMNFNKCYLLFLFFILAGKVLVAQSTPLDPSTWMVNPADFSENMIITGVIEINDVEIQDVNYKISAFVNGECRGVAKPVYIPQLNRYLVTLFVYSDGGNENVEFWVHQETANVVLPVIDDLPYSSAVPIGTPANPYIFETLRANISFEKDDVLCTADDNGFVKAAVNLGVSEDDFNFSLLWSTGSTDATITNLFAGKYYLTVTVGGLFEFVDSVEILNLNRTIQKPNLLAAPAADICIGDDVFILAYTNETEDPQYNWFDIFDNLIETTDVLKIPELQADKLVYAQTEIRNCLSERVPISLSVFEIPKTSFRALPSVGEVGETIKFFTGEPERGNTIYRWEFGDNTFIADGKPSVEHSYEEEGVYEVKLIVTTAEGCSRQSSELISILEPEIPDGGGVEREPIIFGFNVNDALCSDDNSGSISAQVFNGTPPIRYAWSNGANTASIGDLFPGNYSVTITDATGKRGVGFATVATKYSGNIQAPSIIVNGGRPVCESSDIWISAINNLPEAEVYWYDSPLSTTPIFQGNPLILFNIQDSDDLYVDIRVGGCASERVPVNINVIQLFSEFDASATIAPVGFGIDFTSIGVGNNQSYQWDFGDGTTATGNAANHVFRNPGIYEVKLTATQLDGCSETSSKIIRITQQGALGVAFNITNVLCADDTNGSIALEIVTGTPPYIFAWSNGETGSEITNLGVGTYTVTITDQSSAAQVQAIEIVSENPPIEIPSVSINGGAVVCAGEDVILAAITNVADAEYRWYDAPTSGNLLYNGASYPLNNIQENQEVFVEAFFNGCFSPGRAATLIRVTGPDATFTPSSTTINEGGTVTFDANVKVNSNIYTWDFADGNAGDGVTVDKVYESTGLYDVTLTVTDSVGCTASTSQIIQVVSAADMVVSFLIENVACENDQNGQVRATVFNGKPPFTFQWSNGAGGNTINNLPAGTYIVTVTDAEGQSLTEATEVIAEVNNLLPPTVALVGDSLVCPGQSVTIYAYNQQQGNFSYHWFDAAEGGNLLAVTNTLIINGRDIPETLFVESRAGSCRSDSRSPVNVTSMNPNTGFSASSTTVVQGNEVTFTPNLIDPNYTYNWFFNDGFTSEAVMPTYSFPFAGTYRVRLNVQNSNGCMESSYLNINVITTDETALILNATQPTCEGDTNGKIVAEVVNGTLPYTFIWSNGSESATIDALAEGSYSVTLTDATGAEVIKTIDLVANAKRPAQPMISINANTPICYQDDLLLTGTSNEQSVGYLWYDQDYNLLNVGSTLVIDNIATSGTIFLEAQREGCSSEPAEVALQVQKPDASFTVNQNGIANINEALTFLPTVATYPTYTWNFGDGSNSSQFNPVHTYLNMGSFDVSLTVKDADGCSNTVVKEDFVNITPADILKLNFDVNNILCDADSLGSIHVIPSAGTAPYTYQWSNGTTQSLADDLSEGSYTVTVTDAQGRISIGNVQVTKQNIQIPPPTVTINGNAPVCKDSDAFLLGKNTQFSNAQTQWFTSANALEPISTADLLVLRAIQENRVLYVESQVDGCNSQRIPLEVTVQAPSADFRVTPSPDIMEGDVVQFRLMEMNPTYTYYWAFGDNGWSETPEPYYFYNVVGEFDVQLQVIDEDGCENIIMKENLMSVRAMPASGVISDPQVLRNQITGSPQNNIRVTTFPNPFQDNFTVLMKVEQTDHYKVTLTDMLGRVHYVQELEIAANVPFQLQMEGGNLSMGNGMYLLHIENKDTKIIHKLIKQNQ